MVDEMRKKWLQEMAMKKAISDVDSYPVPHPSTLLASSSSSLGSSFEGRKREEEENASENAQPRREWLDDLLAARQRSQTLHAVQCEI